MKLLHQGFFFFNFLMFANWLHMLGGGGIVHDQCDFFIGIIGTLHYFELRFWHLRKNLGSIKWKCKNLRCMVNGLHGFLPCKKTNNPFYVYVGELANMWWFLYKMWWCNNFQLMTCTSEVFSSLTISYCGYTINSSINIDG